MTIRHTRRFTLLSHSLSLSPFPPLAENFSDIRSLARSRKRRNDVGTMRRVAQEQSKICQGFDRCAPFAILMPITRQQASREIRVNPRGVLTLIKARSSLEEFKTASAPAVWKCLKSSRGRPQPWIIIGNHYRICGIARTRLYWFFPGQD